MLNAFLYRTRRSLIHSPLSLVLTILGIGLSVLMILVPCMESGEDAVVVSETIKLGAINIFVAAMGVFMYYTGLFSGVVGYSYSDVNFQLAGPFTEKFNLIIAALASIKISFLFLFVLSCQSAVVYMAIGVRGWYFVLLLVGAFLAMLLSYVFGAFLGAVTCNDAKKRRTVAIVSGVIIGLFVVGALGMTVYKTGSVSDFLELSKREMIGKVGSNVLFQIMPVSGWVAMICDGILINDMIFILIGSLLSVGTVAVLIMLYANYDFDYYETAIEGAQRILDMKAARRAGVDVDTTNLNRKVKVGKENIKSGWGASAFSARHHLENARSTRFFFVNKLALLYRAMALIYAMIIVKDSESVKEAMIPLMSMNLMLGLIIYGGGKTVLEFNKPYIFMVPERDTAKVMACVLGDLPEIIFDSIMCAGVMTVAVGIDIPVLLATFVFSIFAALLCQLTALLCLCLFKNLGRYPLMVVRYFLIIGALIVTIVPGIIVGNIVGGGPAAFLLFSAAFEAGVSALVLLLVCKLVSRLEYK